MVFEFTVAAVVLLVFTVTVLRFTRAHYRRRWLEAVKVIESLQDQDQEPPGTREQVQIAGPGSVQVQAGADVRWFPTAPVPAQWSVNARNIAGRTEVRLVAPGVKPLTLAVIPRDLPDYSGKLCDALRRAHKQAGN